MVTITVLLNQEKKKKVILTAKIESQYTAIISFRFNMKFCLSSTGSKKNMNFDIFPVSLRDLTPIPASIRHVFMFRPFPYRLPPCNGTVSVRNSKSLCFNIIKKHILIPSPNMFYLHCLKEIIFALSCTKIHVFCCYFQSSPLQYKAPTSLFTENCGSVLQQGGIPLSNHHIIKMVFHFHFTQSTYYKVICKH